MRLCNRKCLDALILSWPQHLWPQHIGCWQNQQIHVNKCVGVHYDLSVIQRWMLRWTQHTIETDTAKRESERECLPAYRSVLLHLLLCTLFRMLGFQGSVVVLLFVMMATEIERQAPTGEKKHKYSHYNQIPISHMTINIITMDAH